jgi:hypothetical protein
MLQPPLAQISADKVDGTTKGDCKRMGIVQQGNRTAGQLQRRKTSIFSEYHYYASPPRSGLVLHPLIRKKSK